MTGRGLVAAAAAVALALSLGGARPAVAAFPGTNGKIAFFWAGEIHVMNADGTGDQSLVPGVSPVWSPNGRRIAFDSLRDGNSEIYVMGADGNGLTRLTDQLGLDYLAAWAPDGRRIAFTSERDGNEEVYVVAVDGTGLMRLPGSTASDREPAWSPDGTQIAFTSERDGNPEVYVMQADGSEQTRLTNNPGADAFPAWSPDGRRLAFQSDRDGNFEIYVMDADGSGPTRLTFDPSRDLRPAWSPDGFSILFESDRDADVWDRDVFVMAADGTGQRRIRSGPDNGRDADWQPTRDLALSLGGSRTAVVGGSALYLLAVANRSPAAAGTVTARLALPAAARLVSVRPNRGRCTGLRTLSCTFGSLGPGGSAAITLVLRPSRAGQLRLRASVRGAEADPSPANDARTAVTIVRRG